MGRGGETEGWDARLAPSGPLLAPVPPRGFSKGSQKFHPQTNGVNHHYPIRPEIGGSAFAEGRRL